MILGPSARRVTAADARAIARALPAFVSPVAVFVNPTRADVDDARAWGFVPQLSGDEDPAFCAAIGPRYVKALHVEPGVERLSDDLAALADAFPDGDLLCDTRIAGAYGGTGRTFAWTAVESLVRRRRVIVSGGLTPENVAACVVALRPFGVDVRSGVERDDRKDPARMRAFVRAVRETDAST